LQVYTMQCSSRMASIVLYAIQQFASLIDQFRSGTNIASRSSMSGLVVPRVKSKAGSRRSTGSTITTSSTAASSRRNWGEMQMTAVKLLDDASSLEVSPRKQQEQQRTLRSVLQAPTNRQPESRIQNPSKLIGTKKQLSAIPANEVPSMSPLVDLPPSQLAPTVDRVNTRVR
jgi:hypothetical protein